MGSLLSSLTGGGNTMSTGLGSGQQCCDEVVDPISLLGILLSNSQSMSDRRSRSAIFFRDRIAIGNRHLAKRSQCDRRSQNQ